MDRSRSGVSLSAEDLRIVQGQLGRSVENVLSVVARCSYGYPSVVLSYPLRNGRPFPTIHYLTCPHLVREVSRLEGLGWIQRFEQRIAEDELFRCRYLRAHELVKQKRESLLAPEHWTWREALSKVGSGGIKNLTTVKCLHLHLADHLAGVDNPVGEGVLELIDKRECDDRRCDVFI